MVILGPAMPPSDLEFSARSFGARTTCKVVKKECGAHSSAGDGSDAERDVAFDCKAKTTGLDLRGNFSDVLPTDAGSPKENQNSLQGQNQYSWSFQYYKDSQKTKWSDNGIPDNYNSPHLYWAFVFTLDSGWTSTSGTGSSDSSGDTSSSIGGHGDSYPFDSRGLVGQPDGGIGGILSCNTDIFDVVSARPATLSLHFRPS